MDPEGISQCFQAMKVNDQDVNILLLGETGVGKSTFINAFANYIEYDEFHIAEKNSVRCLVPAKFTVTNENFVEKIVEIGKDKNENNTISQSATLETRSYVFPKGGIRIRLIDTPGIGDTRGIDQDNENLENILSFISNMENLHAICFLLKPNNSRLTVMFDYCIKQLLSRLEKSASKNIIFIFTNSRQTFYKPGDTTTALKKVLDTIKSRPPYAEINFHKDNVFCLDNESFRYLVATKNGVQLGNKQSFADSWAHSVRECTRLVDFIAGKGNSTLKITPHKVKDTMSVNEARRVVLQLSQPLADIADVINDNIKALERHNRTLQMDNLSIEDLKKNLYVPVMNIRCKELSEPTTVCTANDCIEIYTVNDIKKYHYKQRCHDPCYLKNVPREYIGSPELMNCWAMTNRKCKICQCDFSTHMHIYYTSETYMDKIDNQSVKAQIQDRKGALKETKKMIAIIESRKLSYENEKNTIIKTMANFAHFLQTNAIAPYNDGYKAYIEYLIDRERSQGPNCDFEIIKGYNDMLKRYGEEKKFLDEALSSNSTTNITATFVLDSVQHLYNLPNMGSKIKQMHKQMVRNQSNEYTNNEVVFQEATRQGKQNKGDNRNKKNSKPKAKDRYSENNKGRYQNHQSNTHQNNIPDLRSINMQAFYQGNYQHQPPNRFFNQPPWSPPRPRFPPQPHQGYPGNFQNYPQQPQYGYPPNLFSQPPLYSNFAQNQGNFPNYSPREAQSRSGNYPNFSEFDRRDFNNRKTPSTNTSDTGVDPIFEEWWRNISADNTNNSQKEDNTAGTRRYNNLSKNRESSDDDTSGDSNDSTKSNSDDEDFKEFMKKNNLDYLVKDSSNRSSSKNTNRKKNKIPKKQPNNSGQDYSELEESNKDNQTKSKSKGFLNQFLAWR